MKLLLALAAVALLAGCDSQTDSTETRYAGELLLNDPSYETLSAPDTVFAGQSFSVRVYTRAGGCDRQGDVETQIEGQSAEVRPFDIAVDPGPGRFCNAMEYYFPHRATLMFSEPGVVTLRATGVSTNSSSPFPIGAPRISVERRVVVVSRGRS